MTTIGAALAQETAAEAVPALDSGDTAWMLTSTALVLMMTVPGVALFYGVNEYLAVLEQAGKTGSIGDGKVFVHTVEHALRIRTGDTGDNAL